MKGAKTPNMSSMDVRSNQRWPTALTMTSWHHFHLTVTHNCQHLPQCCPCNSGNETLYICPIWMWEAICNGLQLKPWHHGIISNEQSSWIAIIWCWKSQKLGSWTVSNLFYNYLIQWFMRWWQCQVVLNLEIMSYVCSICITQCLQLFTLKYWSARSKCFAFSNPYLQESRFLALLYVMGLATVVSIQ